MPLSLYPLSLAAVSLEPFLCTQGRGGTATAVGVRVASFACTSPRRYSLSSVPACALSFAAQLASPPLAPHIRWGHSLQWGRANTHRTRQASSLPFGFWRRWYPVWHPCQTAIAVVSTCAGATVLWQASTYPAQVGCSLYRTLRGPAIVAATSAVLVRSRTQPSSRERPHVHVATLLLGVLCKNPHHGPWVLRHLTAPSQKIGRVVAVTVSRALSPLRFSFFAAV